MSTLGTLRLSLPRVLNQLSSWDNQAGGTDRAGYQLSFVSVRKPQPERKNPKRCFSGSSAKLRNKEAQATASLSRVGKKKTAPHEKEQHEEAGDACWEFQVLNVQGRQRQQVLNQGLQTTFFLSELHVFYKWCTFRCFCSISELFDVYERDVLSELTASYLQCTPDASLFPVAFLLFVCLFVFWLRQVLVGPTYLCGT